MPQESIYQWVESELEKGLKAYVGETPYITNRGTSFQWDNLMEYLYTHFIYDDEHSSTIRMATQDLPGIFLGRVMGNINRVYFDQMDGEDFFEISMMEEAIHNLKVLVRLDESWPVEYLKTVVQNKETKGHFGHVPDLIKEFKELLNI